MTDKGRKAVKAQYVELLQALRERVLDRGTIPDAERFLEVGGSFLRNRWASKTPGEPGRVDLSVHELLALLCYLEVKPSEFFRQVFGIEDAIERLMQLPVEATDEAIDAALEQWEAGK